jgi:drug/metabolite transporter (DMT)-like permease
MSAVTPAPSAFATRELWFNLAVISGAWGSSFLFVKLISHSLQPFTFASARGAIAALALLAWLAIRDRSRLAEGWKSRLPRLAELGHMLVLGTTNGWLANVMTAIAVRYVDSAICAMLQATVPLMVAVLAHFLLAGEGLRTRQCIGVLAGLLGVILIIGPLGTLGPSNAMLGIGAMLMAAFLYACGTIYGRRIVPRDPVTLACGQQTIGAVIAGIIAASIETTSPWGASLEVWGLLVAVGVFCSALPTALYLRLLGRATSVPAALIAYLQPVWATVLGWAMLGEHVASRALLGTAFVFVGVYIGTRSSRRSPAA